MSDGFSTLRVKKANCRIIQSVAGVYLIITAQCVCYNMADWHWQLLCMVVFYTGRLEVAPHSPAFLHQLLAITSDRLCSCPLLIAMMRSDLIWLSLGS